MLLPTRILLLLILYYYHHFYYAVNFSTPSPAKWKELLHEKKHRYILSLPRLTVTCHTMKTQVRARKRGRRIGKF